MAGPLYFNHVKETTTSTGAGPFTLAGAVMGNRTFGATVGNGNSCTYDITDGTDWMTCIGTYTASGGSLSVDYVLESSNGGAAVTFAAGTKSVSLVLSAAAIAQMPEQCCGRLTLESGAPVSSSDQAAKTNVYFTPYRGSRIAVYNGCAWVSYRFSELTLALGTVTSGANYDIFAAITSGAPTLEKVVWTNDTTRATALTTQDGIYVKSGDATRRYLGTIRTTSTTHTEDSATKRFVWNYYHRHARRVDKNDTTALWSYTTDTWRQARAQTANKVEFVVGVAEDCIDISLGTSVNHGGATRGGQIAIGLDSTTAPSSVIVGTFSNQAFNDIPVYLRYVAPVTAGYHYAAWLEKGGDTTCQFGTDVSGNHGLVGTVIA